MVSISGKRVLGAAQISDQLPYLTTAEIPDNQILEDVNGRKVINGSFNSGANITTSTDGANTDKIDSLNKKNGTAIRSELTPHAWLRVTGTNVSGNLAFAWTDEYCASTNQGFRINDQGYLEGGVSPSSFAGITFANGSFGTSTGNSTPVQLYEMGTARIPASTSREVTVQTFTLTNAKPKYDLQIIKKDSDDQNKLLSGAEFKLYRGASVNNLTEIQTQITGDDGKLIFAGLEQGKYWLLETKQPDGYEEPSDEYMQIDIPGQSETSPIEVSVTNKAILYELPETGSSGTKIYTAAGTILLLTGTGLYRYKKRGKRKGGEPQ